MSLFSDIEESVDKELSWSSKDWVVTLFKELNTSHIRSIINMFEKSGVDYEYMAELKSELDFREYIISIIEDEF